MRSIIHLDICYKVIKITPIKRGVTFPLANEAFHWIWKMIFAMVSHRDSACGTPHELVARIGYSQTPKTRTDSCCTSSKSIFLDHHFGKLRVSTTNRSHFIHFSSFKFPENSAALVLASLLYSPTAWCQGGRSHHGALCHQQRAFGRGDGRGGAA